MIKYLYKFDDSEEYFEIEQSIKDNPIEEIEGRKCHRVITGGSSIHLIGYFPGKEIKSAEKKIKHLSEDPLQCTIPEWRKKIVENGNIVWHDEKALNKQIKMIDDGV